MANDVNVVRNVAEQIAEHMEEIRKLFVPGRRFAFVSWTPGRPERDMIVMEPEGRIQEIIEVCMNRLTDPDNQIFKVDDER